MTQIELTNENFEEVINENNLVLIDFNAVWCGPCRALGAILDAIAATRDDDVAICKCDVDKNRELADQFGVRNIPFIAFIQNGDLVDTMVGLHQEEELNAKIDELLQGTGTDTGTGTEE